MSEAVQKVGDEVGEVVQMRPARRVAPAKKQKEAVKGGESARNTRTKRKTLRAPRIHAAEARTISQFIAAVGGAFLPLSSFVTAHYDTTTRPMMWMLVAAALVFSAPTLVEWAERWCGSRIKAVGFAVLLEGTMILSGSAWLSYGGLAILMAINLHSAWTLAGRKQERQGGEEQAA